MPKKSKRMAARQAALSRKKKSSRTSVYRAPEEPSKTAPTQRAAAPAPRPAAAPVPDESLPEFAVPQEAEAPAPRPVAQAAPVTGRRGVALRMPYLQSDLRSTARAGVVLAAALVALAFVL